MVVQLLLSIGLFTLSAGVVAVEEDVSISITLPRRHPRPRSGAASGLAA
jgi:hypothetical protein